MWVQLRITNSLRVRAYVYQNLTTLLDKAFALLFYTHNLLKKKFDTAGTAVEVANPGFMGYVRFQVRQS